MRSIATVVLLALSTIGANAGSIVNVTFVEPDKFYDAANSTYELEGNLKTIEEHLKALGQRHLPDGQVLNISVLDVDLAGYMKPLPRSARQVRIALGAADWPKFRVRYTVEAAGTTVKSGEEVVADMNYSRHAHTNIYTNDDPLRLEKQMLDSWFQARFRREN